MWNYNHVGDSSSFTGRGVQDFELLISTDNVVYTSLGTMTLSQAPGLASYTGEVVDPADFQARFVRFDILSNHQGGDDAVDSDADPNTGVTETRTLSSGESDLTVDAGLVRDISGDLDGDGIVNAEDNCPAIANPGQSNHDSDRMGNVCDNDDDNDGLPDAFELAAGLDPLDPTDAMLDPDFDAFNNLEEFAHGTDPQNADSDGDGLDDGQESALGRHPLVPNFPVTLHAGFNVVGFPAPPLGYTAFLLLRTLGDADTAASIQRFNPDTSRFATAAYNGAQPVGVNFLIQRGEGYLIAMKQGVQGLPLLEPPVVAITSPARNAVLDTANIDVSGTISEDNVQVTVNGVTATVGGNSFLATDVPLVEGLNTLTAVAEDT